MMKPTKDGYRHDLHALAVELTRTWNRDLLDNSLVRATRIEIVQPVLFKDVLHVSSSENDDVIQTFASGAAKESFADGVHQWRLKRSSQYFHASALRNTIKFGPKLVVVVANDELGPFTERRDIAKLLGRPFRGWGARNANMHNSL